MITNPDWNTPKEEHCFHQISQDCMLELAGCVECFDKGLIDDHMLSFMCKQILSVEINDPDFLAFSLQNIHELLPHVTSGDSTIRIYKDVNGDTWFGVGNT
ncbi:MAG: hypothetical protein SCALA701_11810 [Candidatus Scalindua sp.]|nr:hypothetical protein [Planctomycetota bacterium]RZV88041.1 MAG: hypothetical protein EX341_06955 [Candidatus Scalindua sp. SCAELEC01]GJQ58380.1 MAG: hypothetical protein SCALA701_11810 [Candidatus Scalindua sp.]